MALRQVLVSIIQSFKRIQLTVFKKNLTYLSLFIILLIYQKERNFNIKNKDRDWSQGTAHPAN
jgi:hypothetical protein